MEHDPYDSGDGALPQILVVVGQRSVPMCTGEQVGLVMGPHDCHWWFLGKELLLYFQYIFNFLFSASTSPARI